MLADFFAIYDAYGDESDVRIHALELALVRLL